MITLSASLIKDLLSCSMRGYWRIHYPEYAKKTPEMGLGDVVHKLIEDHWDKKSIEDIGSHFQECTASLDKDDIEKAKKCINTYFSDFKGYCSKNDVIEKYFRIRLPNHSDVDVVGKIDRINTDLGILLDWKTGPKAPPSIDNDIQFILYDWAYQTMYGKKPNMVGLANLQTGKLVKYKENKKITNYFFGEMIDKVVSMVRDGSYTRDGIYQYITYGNLSMACSHCSFRQVCHNAEDYNLEVE